MGNIHEDFTKYLADTIKEMRNRWEKVDPILIKELANRGWFLNMSHTDKFSYTALYDISEKQYEKVDQWFEDYYSSEADDIILLLIKKHPEIEGMLNDVIKCHNQAMYFASIPLFFVIAEFIANKRISDILGTEETNLIFNRSRSGLKKKPGTLIISHFLQSVFERYSINNPFDTSSPIYSDHTLNINTHKLPNESPFELNRHSVLHGMSNVYGNRQNSLKALCYVDFLDIELIHLKSQLERENDII